jgi:hypothetical protein
MNLNWRTAWQGQDIVVYRDDAVVDRVHAPDIRRVILVYRNAGDTPGELAFALVELADEHVLFPPETGFAGRVHFERLAFWAERSCVYWVSESKAALPARFRPGLWLLRRTQPQFVRVPRAELADVVNHWPLEGPQSWEERKERRVQRSLPFADLALPPPDYSNRRRRA